MKPKEMSLQVKETIISLKKHNKPIREMAQNFSNG